MEYDYRKLVGRIIEKYGSQSLFAKELGLSEHSLSVKLNNKGEFKQKEISRSCQILDIGDGEIADYFFTLIVQSA